METLQKGIEYVQNQQQRHYNDVTNVGLKSWLLTLNRQMLAMYAIL